MNTLCECEGYPCPRHDPDTYRMVMALGALERIVGFGVEPACSAAKEALCLVESVRGGVTDETGEST